MMCSRAAVFFLYAFLPSFVTAGHSDLVRDAKKVDFVACPVIAGMYQRGFLNPDESGRVSAHELKGALMAIGVSEPSALFQSTGIAGYLGNDPHQNVRRNQGQRFLETLYVNIFSMNPGDNCAVAGESAHAGVPCNANTQFLQHGYSTTMRDSRFDKEDPDRQKRFDFWLGQELVDASSVSPKLDTQERVLLLDGMARTLARAYAGTGDSPMLSGDFSSEYSLNPSENFGGSNIQKFHPSVTEPRKYKALSTWQPLLAWTGWWSGFARKSGTTEYFTESDLKGFFMRGEYPKDWKPMDSGFESAYTAILPLDGKAVGEEWVSIVKEMMLPEGAYMAELRYSAETLKTLIDLGMVWDSNHNTWPPQANASTVIV